MNNLNLQQITDFYKSLLSSNNTRALHMQAKNLPEAKQQLANQFFEKRKTIASKIDKLDEINLEDLKSLRKDLSIYQSKPLEEIRMKIRFGAKPESNLAENAKKDLTQTLRLHTKEFCSIVNFKININNMYPNVGVFEVLGERSKTSLSRFKKGDLSFRLR